MRPIDERINKNLKKVFSIYENSLFNWNVKFKDE